VTAVPHQTPCLMGCANTISSQIILQCWTFLLMNSPME
jgi:hypothetical protein